MRVAVVVVARGGVLRSVCSLLCERMVVHVSTCFSTNVQAGQPFVAHLPGKVLLVLLAMLGEHLVHQ